MGDGMSAEAGSTCLIVKAYVSHNRVPPGGIGGLILEVHRALVGLCQAELPAWPERTLPQIRRKLPATVTFSPEGSRPTPDAIRRSITETHLISFEDGKPYAMLKRHLSARGMTPEEYREKWGLAADYPMVAPHFTAKRSKLAVRTGLGRNKEAPRPERSKPTLVEIRRSISDTRLISFEDGQPYEELESHLSSLGMTPGEYRKKWGLPSDYPMVAPNHMRKRAALAQRGRLGPKRPKAGAAAGSSASLASS